MSFSPIDLPGTLRALLRFHDLRRPRLLIRAARFGLADHRREQGLRRVLGDAAAPLGERTLARLLDREQELEEARRDGLATYRPARHVEALTAVMAEAQLLMLMDPPQGRQQGTHQGQHESRPLPGPARP